MRYGCYMNPRTRTGRRFRQQSYAPTILPYMIFFACFWGMFLAFPDKMIIIAKVIGKVLTGGI